MKYLRLFEIFVQHVRETGYKCVSGHSRVTGHCTLNTIFDDLITEWSQRPGGQTGKEICLCIGKM